MGFSGPGYLGSRIARRLAAAGFPLVVHDRDLEKTKELAALGATVAPNPETLAADVDVVLSCLPSDATLCRSKRPRAEV
jgi:3-hydroxyisobutyrate dehydrogenase